MPASEKWNSVCYGNGRFVAVADQSKVSAYSTDGINWTETTWNVGHDWSSVCYGNGKFVAVDSFNSNIAAYSTDGVNWTETTLPAKKNWSSVCYGNGKFIAVVEGSNIAAYSEDGISWTQTTLPANKDWISVCYGNGKFVVTTNGSNVAAYSTDGITWTQTTMPANKSWYSVCYGNGKFVAVDYNGAAAFSTDGITWLNTNTTRVFQNAAGEDISEDVKEAIGAATETYVDNAIAAIPTPDVSGQIATHNTANDAHQDIRNGLTGAVAVLNDHLANVLNPHGVTAEQVGARPDTWMPKMSDVAYLGENLIASTADDTTANWAGFGSGYVWYSAASHLIDQPSTYGFLVNYVYGSDIFQIWHSQNSGPMYTRSGNANGWSDSWKKHITTNDITYGTADLTAGSSALETGKLYFVYE